jgi:hypothetical protein
LLDNSNLQFYNFVVQQEQHFWSFLQANPSINFTTLLAIYSKVFGGKS